MNQLLDLRVGYWNLHILAQQDYEQLLIACAYLAESSDLIVLDCGRRYNPSIVARAACGRTETTDRIQSQRAFNCFEVTKLLQRTPVSKAPVLVLDMLSTFYDENVQLRMRAFLLENSIIQLGRISAGAGLAVFAQPPTSESDSLYLFERFQNAASQVLTHAADFSGSGQLLLF